MIATKQPSLLPKSKKRGGGGGGESSGSAFLEDPLFEQPPLEGPGSHIESMMGGLPEPGTYHKSHRARSSRPSRRSGSSSKYS